MDTLPPMVYNYYVIGRKAMQQQPPTEKIEDIQNRLSKVLGQVRGVQKMMDNPEDCEKIIQQTAAARKALDKTYYLMIACIFEMELMSHVQRRPEIEKDIQHMIDLLSKYS